MFLNPIISSKTSLYLLITACAFSVFSMLPLTASAMLGARAAKAKVAEVPEGLAARLARSSRDIVVDTNGISNGGGLEGIPVAYFFASPEDGSRFLRQDYAWRQYQVPIKSGKGEVVKKLYYHPMSVHRVDLHSQSAVPGVPIHYFLGIDPENQYAPHIVKVPYGYRANLATSRVLKELPKTDADVAALFQKAHQERARGRGAKLPFMSRLENKVPKSILERAKLYEQKSGEKSSYFTDLLSNRVVPKEEHTSLGITQVRAKARYFEQAHLDSKAWRAWLDSHMATIDFKTK